MDEDQQLLQQRTPLLPTGVPNGSDEGPRSTRSRRQTRQVQQRIGHEDQIPVFPNGFGTPHAILIEAQVLWFNQNGHLDKGGKIGSGGVP
jgi:hypothetical protein